MRKRIFKTVIIFLLSLLSASFIGCRKNLYVVSREKDYSDFLSELEIYKDPSASDEDEKPSEPSDPSADFTGIVITGFEPLYYTDFDYASPFSENFAFAKKDGIYLAVGKDGKVTEVYEDLEGSALISDKYVYTQNRMKGVKTVFGETVVEAEYSEIVIKGSSVAALRDNGITDIFDGNGFVCSTEERVELVSEDFLFGMRGVYSLDMTPVYCGACRMITPPVNGIGVISGGELYGYGNVDGDILIEPRYKEFSDFYCGYAAVITQDGENCIIDINGNEIISASDEYIRFLSFDGQYLIYSEYGQIHVADENATDVTEHVFDGISGGRVFNGLIVTDNATRVFSLTENKYVSERFVSVAYKNGLFIAENQDGTFAVYNGEFGLIAQNFEFAAYESDVLTVRCDGKYYFYTAG